MHRSRREPDLARILSKERAPSRTVEAGDEQRLAPGVIPRCYGCNDCRSTRTYDVARTGRFSLAVSLRPHSRMRSLEVGGSTCVVRSADASRQRRWEPPTTAVLSPQEPASPRAVVSRPTDSAAPGKRGTNHEEAFGRVGEHGVARERWRGVRTATDAEAVRQFGRSPAPTGWNQDGAGRDDA